MPEPKKTVVTSTTPETAFDWQHFYRTHPMKSPTELAAQHISPRTPSRLGAAVSGLAKGQQRILAADVCIALVAAIVVLARA